MGEKPQGRTVTPVKIVNLLPIPVTPTGGGDVNQPTFVTGNDFVVTPGTAVQLNAGVALPIPNGFVLIVKSPKLNTGIIYVGNSAANAQNPLVAYSLEKQEFIGYGITDVSTVWIDATVAGEGVTWTVEQA